MAWDLGEALSYYKKQGAPGDQTVLISLLREIQQENQGGIPLWMLREAAEAYGVRETYLQAVVRRIPSLRMENTHCLEVCSGPNCGKNKEIQLLTEQIQKKALPGLTVRYIGCMRMCGKGPNLRWDGKVYHGADSALLCQLLKEMEEGLQK